MTMRTFLSPRKRDQRASALILTMIMTGIALAILAGAMTWSANATRQTHRSIQYTRSVAAAEAATEKVVSRIVRDFLFGGEKMVSDNLASYRLIVPSTADSSTWGQWEFNDAGGHTGQTYVQGVFRNKYVVLNSTYAGLRGFVSTYSVASHARELAALQNVVGGVLQEVQLARIPVFQFAMYSSGDMEISCGQPLAVTGRVHSNGQLYVEPDNTLTFLSDVTAVQNILFQRHPLDTRGPPSGGAIYVYPDRKISHVPAMTLPIGTTNTPEAIREILQPPPFGEDPNSPIGRLRYYNQAEMIIVVTNSGLSLTNTQVVATSGRFNNFSTIIPTNELALFVVTTNFFTDAREEKTVRPIDLNVGIFKAWSETNASLRVALDSLDVSSVYVWDRRTLAGTNLGAVRVFNGLLLPSRGLTVATARPLYSLGHYNQTTR